MRFKIIFEGSHLLRLDKFGTRSEACEDLWESNSLNDLLAKLNNITSYEAPQKTKQTLIWKK